MNNKELCSFCNAYIFHIRYSKVKVAVNLAVNSKL